jgi:hypothetical protein
LAGDRDPFTGKPMTHDLSGLKRDCPLWRIWHADGPYLYAVRVGLFSVGQGTTVFAQTVEGLRAEIAKAEAEAAQKAQQRERLAALGNPAALIAGDQVLATGGLRGER